MILGKLVNGKLLVIDIPSSSWNSIRKEYNNWKPVFIETNSNDDDSIFNNNIEEEVYIENKHFILVTFKNKNLL